MILNKTITLPFALLAILITGCGKHETPQEKSKRLQTQAAALCESISHNYEQEIDLVKNETDQLKVKDLLGEVVGDKKYVSNFWESVFKSISPDRIPFHKYNELLKHDIQSLKRFIDPLNKYKENKQIQMTLNKSIDLMDNLKEIQSYVLKHREYRDEERYLTICAAGRWV